MVVGLTVAAALACVDGPFARANPHDPTLDIEMWIESVRGNTITGQGTLAAFRLHSDPAFPGYPARWTVVPVGVLVPVGSDGIFRVDVRDGQPATVTVRAYWGNRVASLSVDVVP